MAYTVLARKYRPQRFDDLVGQEHVARSLSNAIGSDRVAHAFLFTGVRGVGKTTTARLLAKALNCEKGPTATPCNECSPCLEIAAGIDVDVQEIDGASNNSVEDVRRLQESLPYRPQRDRHKIVIVDEVHMLSTGAFNAFLKTLEEPPEHVKFIFATTESHKVPITIRSRCQQYDFRLIPRPVITERVKHILAEENAEADEGAINTIVREAAGSMRDALTLLDQLIALCGDQLTAGGVMEALGIATNDSVHALGGAVLRGDGGQVIRTLGELQHQSVDVVHLSKQLLRLFRDLVVLKLSPDVPGEWAPGEREAALALVEDVDVLELQRAFRAVSLVIDDMAQTMQPELILEMGLVRVATRPPLKSIDELLQRLDGSGGSSGSRTSPRVSDSDSASDSASDSTSDSDSDSDSASDSASDSTSDSDTTSDTAPAEVKPATKRSSGFQTSSGEVLAPVRRAALQEWEHLVASLREEKPALAAVLEHGVPRAVNTEKIVLSFQKGSFYGRQAEAEDSLEMIAAAAERQLGAKPEIEIRFDAEDESKAKTVAAVSAQRKEAAIEAKKQEALSHPAVQDAIAVFPDSKGKVDVHLEAE